MTRDDGRESFFFSIVYYKLYNFDAVQHDDEIFCITELWVLCVVFFLCVLDVLYRMRPK